jgi:hypothetical protein
MKLFILLLTASLVGTGPVPTAADTTRAPARPPASSVGPRGSVKEPPRKPAKPVGDPVLKRRRPPL